MTSDVFEVIVDMRCLTIKNILAQKAAEYAREDRLHNFKVAARMDNETPERALWGMQKKHLVSIMDIINDVEKGVMPSLPLINEKIGDAINYLILLEALLKERINEPTTADVEAK